MKTLHRLKDAAIERIDGSKPVNKIESSNNAEKKTHEKF